MARRSPASGRLIVFTAIAATSSSGLFVSCGAVAEGASSPPGRKTWPPIKQAGFSSVDLDWSPLRPRSGLYVPDIARRAIA